MKLHTGESLVKKTPDWTWQQREKLGQRYLRDLAEDILGHWDPENTRYSGESLLDDGVRVAMERKPCVFASSRGQLEFLNCVSRVSEGSPRCTALVRPK